MITRFPDAKVVGVVAAHAAPSYAKSASSLVISSAIAATYLVVRTSLPADRHDLAHIWLH